MRPAGLLVGPLLIGPLLIGTALLAGCSAGGAGPAAAPASTAATPQGESPGNPPVAPGPAEPGVAPPVNSPPAGRVIAVGNNPEAVAAGSGGTAAVGLKDPDGIALVDIDAGVVRKVVPTGGGAPRHLDLAGPDGPVLAPLEQTDTVLTVALSDGAIVQKVTGVGRNPHNAVRTADGTEVVNNELGGGVIFLSGGAIVGALPPGPPQPGGLAAVGRFAVVSDVRGQGVWVYDASTRKQVAQAPVGQQLTHTIALGPPGSPEGTGVVAVADTMGGGVFLERITPQVQQLARIDTPGRPYGLAYDATHRLLFITLTASNLLRVVDVADPAAPRTLGDLPTVRQPNSVAVDPRTGTVLVAGTVEGQLQLIPPSALPHG